MKKISIIMIIMFVIPFITNVNAEILIQIEENDGWVYNITASPTKTVSFEVIGVDYFGEAEDLIRVNNVVANDTIETPRINNINLISFFVNCSLYHYLLGSANMNISTENIVSDCLWRTARGNILYQRETVVDTILYFSDIDFNNTVYDDWQTNTTLTLIETISNPNIIEPLSTGTVKLNNRTITIDGVITDVDFLGLGYGVCDVEISLEILEAERYEASDLFTYMDTDCRNLTISPLEAHITKSNFISTYFFFEMATNIDLVTPLGVTEDWIYSFDVGLPLLIVETAEVVSLSKGAVIESVETIRTMKLIDSDLVNSDFEFNGEEPTTNLTSLRVGLLSVLMVTYILFYVKNKRP